MNEERRKKRRTKQKETSKRTDESEAKQIRSKLKQSKRAEQSKCKGKANKSKRTGKSKRRGKANKATQTNREQSKSKTNSTAGKTMKLALYHPGKKTGFERSASGRKPLNVKQNCVRVFPWGPAVTPALRAQ